MSDTMKCGIDGNLIIVKLANGEDVFQNIIDVVKTNNIRSGLILSGIGMIKEFELGYFDPGGYITKIFSKPHELVSMSGSIAYDENDNTKPILHIHSAVANREQKLFGGHLHKATVNVINEIVIQRLNDINLNRIKNENTGLMELNIESSYTY